MSQAAQLSITAPGATPEQAAAVATAIDRFRRDHAPRTAPEPAGTSPWLQASLREGVARQPGLLPDWI